MRIERTQIDGVDLIHWDLIADARGGFARIFCKEVLAAAGIVFSVEQANISTNLSRHTLRGLHYQRSPHGESKIVSCRAGRIFDVAVDMREGSPTWRRWLAFELGRDIPLALHLSSGIAHGFLTLEPNSDVHYLMGAPYVPGAARGIRWDDPAIAINWPAGPKVIAARDSGYALLEPT